MAAFTRKPLPLSLFLSLSPPLITSSLCSLRSAFHTCSVSKQQRSSEIVTAGKIHICRGADNDRLEDYLEDHTGRRGFFTINNPKTEREVAVVVVVLRGEGIRQFNVIDLHGELSLTETSQLSQKRLVNRCVA